MPEIEDSVKDIRFKLDNYLNCIYDGVYKEEIKTYGVFDTILTTEIKDERLNINLKLKDGTDIYLPISISIIRNNINDTKNMLSDWITYNFNFYKNRINADVEKILFKLRVLREQFEEGMSVVNYWESPMVDDFTIFVNSSPYELRIYKSIGCDRKCHSVITINREYVDISSKETINYIHDVISGLLFKE